MKNPTELCRPAASLFHRPSHGPTQCQPAYDRQLSGHLPATVGICSGAVTPVTLDAWPLRTWTLRSSAVFSTIWKQDRGNTPRSRNIRLAAIHSFFKYVALQEPSLSSLAQQVLAIPVQTPQDQTDRLFDSSRDRRPSGRSRPKQLSGASRPDACCWWRANGTTRFRVDWAALPGRVLWAVAPTFVASAKDAKHVAPHCAKMRSRLCVPGYANEMANPPMCSFPMPAGCRSAMMGSITSCPSTSPPHGPSAPPLRRNGSPPTY